MKTFRQLSVLTTLLLAGAVIAPAGESSRLEAEVRDTIQLIQQSDAKVRELFETAYGYAVFPSISKGAIGIGAASGPGQVFEKNQLIGTARLTQVTIGAQLGVQNYAEVIFFENQKALNDFTNGQLTMHAGASAVAAAEGASVDARYQHGVRVLTRADTGLMFEASVGGQGFRFTPLPSSARALSGAPASPLGERPVLLMPPAELDGQNSPPARSSSAQESRLTENPPLSDQPATRPAY